MPNEVELLAPAGSMDALKAALANGADAVYLGAAAFGARASAGFDAEALENALRLAHLYRKKIYVTVNILIREGELPDVRRTLSLLSHLGADAVLVQDLGALKICREEFPELPLHASTQMALHNASGVAFLRRLGARRIVLARECDLAAIRSAAATGVEVEAFCHGALCVSASGQCLFSSMLGGRSGNRGRCAQPCRLDYTYQGKRGAWLSPRDLCARDELPAMVEAGVYSFKIEGRLKRPEYVAVVTRAYRRALDAVLEGRFAPAQEREKESLIQIFSRGGFTKGYLGPARDAAIIDPVRVAPVGLPLGGMEKVYRRGGALLGDARLLRPLHNGDGLEAAGQELRYSGPDVPAGRIATLRLREPVAPGSLLRRTEDECQLSAARATYEGEALNAALPLSFDAELTAYPGRKAVLSVSDGESRATVTGEMCQAAQSRPLDEPAVRRALEKTGGTAFRLRRLTVKTAGAFLPAAGLNALRREALQTLENARIAAQPRPQAPAAHFDAPRKRAFSPRLLARTENAAEIPALLAAGADEVLLAPQDYRQQALLPLLENFPARTRLCLPAQCTEETLRLLWRWTAQYRIPVCAGSPGQLGLFPGAMAGEGVPVMNREAISLLAHLGCESVTLSRELAKADVARLPLDRAELILPVYGRTRLMLLNHCPVRAALGLEKGRTECRLCDQGKGAAHTALADRRGAEYPLWPVRLPEGCVLELLAAQPLHLSAHLTGMPPLSFLAVFTLENAAERQAILSHYAALLRGRAAPLAVRGTVGRFLEGVI